MKAAFEAAHRARFGFIDDTKALVVEAVSVEAIGGGAKFAEPASPRTTAPLPAPARRHAVLFRRRLARRPRSIRATSSRPATRSAGPAIIIEPHQTIVVEARLAGRDHARRTISCSTRVVPLPRAARSAPTPIR